MLSRTTPLELLHNSLTTPLQLPYNSLRTPLELLHKSLTISNKVTSHSHISLLHSIGNPSYSCIECQRGNAF